MIKFNNDVRVLCTWQEPSHFPSKDYKWIFIYKSQKAFEQVHFYHLFLIMSPLSLLPPSSFICFSPSTTMLDPLQRQ